MGYPLRYSGGANRCHFLKFDVHLDGGSKDFGPEVARYPYFIGIALPVVVVLCALLGLESVVVCIYAGVQCANISPDVGSVD